MADRSPAGRTLYDSIVLGAGIQGSFTAYHLAKNARNTLLLEQFLLPHSRGSSHGQTRVIRKAYSEDFYFKMMEECYQLWAQLEQESNTVLFRQTGLMMIGLENSAEFQDTWKTLERNHVPREYLHSQEFQKRFPGVLLQPGESAFSDNTAGVLYADRALRAVQDSFRRMGGTIHDGEKVTNIKPGAEVVVTTSSRVYRTKSLVITAGPWASKLLSPLGLHLPLQAAGWNPSATSKQKMLDGIIACVIFPTGIKQLRILCTTYGCLALTTNLPAFKEYSTTEIGFCAVDAEIGSGTTLRINVCYWKEKVPGSYGVPQKFPCFLASGVEGAEHHIYGLPSNEYPGLIKICYHHGSPADPDMRDCPLGTSSLQDIELLRKFVSKYFPGVEPEPAIVEHCMYTNTPDGNFVLDRHPQFKNIIVGTGFSGHGFKLSPVVGKILCELSMDKEPLYDMSPFRIARFPNRLKSTL